jgi:hypothetical protein
VSQIGRSCVVKYISRKATSRQVSEVIAGRYIGSDSARDVRYNVDDLRDHIGCELRTDDAVLLPLCSNWEEEDVFIYSLE